MRVCPWVRLSVRLLVSSYFSSTNFTKNHCITTPSLKRPSILHTTIITITTAAASTTTRNTTTTTTSAVSCTTIRNQNASVFLPELLLVLLLPSLAQSSEFLQLINLMSLFQLSANGSSSSSQHFSLILSFLPLSERDRE